MGVWCGYAAVPPGHPFHGKSYQDVDSLVDVHGGLTYSGACSGTICHVPTPGEPDDVWWFGFDCGHYYMDLIPSLEIPRLGLDDSVYRDLSYVRVETKALAEQLDLLGQGDLQSDSPNRFNHDSKDS